VLEHIGKAWADLRPQVDHIIGRDGTKIHEVSSVAASR
jgi:hypothetical protein